MEYVINFFEYGVRGIWYVLWVVVLVIVGFAFLGIIGNKQTLKRNAELEKKREEQAKNEANKTHEQMEKNAQFGGIDTTLDEEAKEAEENAQKDASATNQAVATPVVEPVVEPKPTESEQKEEVPQVLNLDEVGTTEVKEEKPVEVPTVAETEKKEEVPEVLDLDKVANK